MRKYILTTPRVGGTAYGKLLSEQHSVKFFNEPFAPYTVYSKNADMIVGEDQLSDYLSFDNFIVHTQVSQFMEYFNLLKKPPESEIIFLERRDKWAQLLSYCITFSLYSRDQEFHNLNYVKEESVQVENRLISMMTNEWTIYSLLKEKYNNSEIVYYEDIIFPKDFSLQKNKGFDKIKISNLDFLVKRFELIWKYNPLLCAE